VFSAIRSLSLKEQNYLSSHLNKMENLSLNSSVRPSATGMAPDTAGQSMALDQQHPTAAADQPIPLDPRLASELVRSMPPPSGRHLEDDEDEVEDDQIRGEDDDDDDEAPGIDDLEEQFDMDGG